MDYSIYGILTLIAIAIFIALVPIIAVIILVTYVASYIGLTGLVWWAFVIVGFIVVNGLIGALLRLGNEN